MCAARLRSQIVVVAAAVLAAIGMGAAAASVPFNALILAFALLAVLIGAWLLGDVKRALGLLVGVIALLPRFASPVSIGFKPTFLDIALVGLLLAWSMAQRDGQRLYPLRGHPIVIPVLLLFVVALATFIVGIPNGALTTLVMRRFAELVLSLLAIVALLAILARPEMQQRFVRAVMLLGGASALMGVVLVAIPDETAIRLLSALRPFDYPSGPQVLRFIRDDPALSQRATGLWIDPNAFGGYLMLCAALCLPQAFVKTPLLPRPLVLLALGVMGLCLVLTVSRGAMLGLAFAGLLMGLLRYRRVLPLGALVLLAALLLPQTRELVAHFVDGFTGADLATQMRYGEYKDAFRLIERYPVLGVGFTGSPDVDLYVGVSSMYLLILQQMGALGLTAFLVLTGVLFAEAARTWPQVRQDGMQTAIFLGSHCALAAAMLSGIFDHYFFNIDFHNSVMWLCSMIALAAAVQTSAVRVSGESSSVGTSQFARATVAKATWWPRIGKKP